VEAMGSGLVDWLVEAMGLEPTNLLTARPVQDISPGRSI
jgi:hypothetical protein